MPVNIVVPELGESVVEATISRWRKQPGDRVAAGEAVVELETEKVNLEVAAERAGVLASVAKQAGEDVRVGEVIGVIEAGSVETGGSPAPAEDSKKPAQASSGQAPAAAPVEATTPVEVTTPAEATAPLAPANQTPSASHDGDHATPVARRLADDHGVDLAQVPASGAGGRITRRDVESFLAQKPAAAPPQSPAKEPVASATPPAPPTTPKQQQPAASSKPALAAVPAGMGSDAPREERVRMSRRRRTIARRLVEAQQTAAMLTTFNEIDLTTVMDIRRRRKEAFKTQHGVGLGFMSFFVKASVAALRAFPILNAEIQGDEIVYKHYYDIGMAIGSSEGLVVPVLRDADRLSFAQIEQAVDGFVQKAQQGTLTLDDLRGGTFTLTNGGVFGSLLSTPILNPPQVGILGLHKIEERPVVRQGQIVIRSMMYAALSYDHRLVDGREAVQFLVRIKEFIEEPEVLLLDS